MAPLCPSTRLVKLNLDTRLINTVTHVIYIYAKKNTLSILVKDLLNIIFTNNMK